jgi:hypothetical protein
MGLFRYRYQGVLLGTCLFSGALIAACGSGYQRNGGDDQDDDGGSGGDGGEGQGGAGQGSGGEAQGSGGVGPGTGGEAQGSGGFGQGGNGQGGSVMTDCEPASVQPCYTGPPGTEDVGICQGGSQVCNDEGTGYGQCIAQVLPSVENCATEADDDCDGTVNEAAECTCVPNTTMACYTGPAGTQNVGICKPGTKTCNATGTGFGNCIGQVLPGNENCNTATDDDCDGVPNDGCGGMCMPVANVIMDGGFELGPGGGEWTEASTNFGTPLCDAGCQPGAGGPQTGTYWAWFGGFTGGTEEGTLTQTVTIPQGTATLTFGLAIPACDTAQDYLEVTVDGNQVFIATGADAGCDSTTYVTKTVNVSGYANGQAHTISLHSETFAVGAASTSFFVDNVVLKITCP